MKTVKSLAIITALLLVACGGEEKKQPQEQATNTKQYDCSITYGWESRKPYQFFENNKMQGIDVDVLAKAADSANCGLVFVEKSWSELLEDVEAGKIDVIAGATPTEERKIFSDFSIAYREESFILFIPVGDSFTGDSLSNFLSFGNKVGISTGYYYGDATDDLMNHPQYSNLFVASPTNEASFFNVEYGRVNGVLVDPIEGRYIVKRKGMGSKMKESGLVIPADSVAYMFSKKSAKQDKISMIKANLEQIVANNQVESFIKNYQ